MLELIAANWLAVALAIVLILVSLILLTRGGAKRTRKRHRAPDALDEGAAPARRNQALIDAPSAAALAKAGDTGVLEREPEPVAKPAPPPPPQPPPPAPPVAEAKPAPAPKPKAAPKLKAPPPPPKKPSAKPKAKAEPKPKPAPAPKSKAAPPSPAPEPASTPPASPPEVTAPAPVQVAGDLARIKGLGPKLQSLLPTLGVATVADIAAWSEADIDRIDAQLGTFAGRIRKDNWVEQAKLLAAGDIAGFEAKFGKL